MRGSGQRSIRQLAAAAALSCGLGFTAGAQDRSIFQWSGRVDQEVRVVMTGTTITTMKVGPREPASQYGAVLASMPRQDGEILLRNVSGRGTIEVIQNPSSLNGYTAIVRVLDAPGGAGIYEFTASWVRSSAGDVRLNDRVGTRRITDPIGPTRNLDRVTMAALERRRVVLQWIGDVDHSVDIEVRPDVMRYMNVAGDPPRDIQELFIGMPRGATELVISRKEGRGEFHIVQQPSASNGYRGVVRLVDPGSGFGRFAFEVNWR
jgi:hypothetical protein